MNVIHVALFIHVVLCVDLQLQIKSFDVEFEIQKGAKKLPFSPKVNETEEVHPLRLRSQSYNPTENNEGTSATSKWKHKTNESLDECSSPETERKEVEGVISDMMNQVTLVFSKVNNYIIKEITRASRKYFNVDLIRRALQSRFKVSRKKRTLVFDEIFNNMSQSYRNFYNSTTKHVFRSDRADCRTLRNVRVLKLLEYSLLHVRWAIRHCMKEYLEEQSISPDSTLGRNVNKLFTSEISQIRSHEINVLCDKLQLCNGTLLQEIVWQL